MSTRHEVKRAMRGLLLEIDPTEVNVKPLTTELQVTMTELLHPQRGEVAAARAAGARAHERGSGFAVRARARNSA